MPKNVLKDAKKKPWEEFNLAGAAPDVAALVVLN